MAAYDASTNAHHGAQSLRQSGPLSFSPPLSTVNHAHQPASPPTQGSISAIDCRWKRGRPVTFSSRAFSTKRADLTTQEDAVAVRPAASDVAGQAHEHRDVEIPPCQSRQHFERPGDVATATQQVTRAEHSPYAVQHNQVATVQMNHAIEGSASLGETFAANATKSSPVDTHGAEVNDKNGAASNPVPNTKLASPRESIMDEATDPDYLPNSTNESTSELEQDASEADEIDEEASETHTPLEFQIPEDVLRAAMTAPENTKASFWSSNLYRGPGGKQILVHYCRTKEVAERVAQHFINEKVVGFDIEWKPYAHPSSIKKNVSLIQLASENRIALFHVALFLGTTAAQLMPPTLKTILESPDVYKVGVAVKGDFSRIVKFLEVEPQGVFELSRLHNLVQFSATDPSKVTNKLVGLAAQVQQHLQLPLYKGGHLVDDPEDLSNVRSSDWSLPLNHQQIHYAAADAYAGFRLYDVLEEKRKQLKPTPPRPLVCDYDSKPKPKSSDSKPRKKRKAATKIDEAPEVTVEEAAALTEPEEGPEEEVEDGLKQSQGTEGYETAQEDLLDSHQLESEEPEPSQGSYEPTDEGEDDVSTDAAHSLKDEGTTASTDPSQRRVGRINLNRLRGPDPSYPLLPDLRGGEEVYTSSDEALIERLDSSEEEDIYQSSDPVDVSRDNQETDEFDDLELEEALHYLNIDGNGRLQEDTTDVTTFESIALSEQPAPSTETGLESEMQAIEERRTKDNKPSETALSATTTVDSASNEGERQLIELLNGLEIVEYLHTPAQPPASSSPPPPPPPSIEPTSEQTEQTEQTEQPSHTPEYDLATIWARTYLSSTIPSPTSLAPSRIRATIPHLRAYNMWHHQELPLGEIARHLCDPPLSESTVGSYVLQAIVLERMEYDREEVRRVLMGMPEALRRGKWRVLAEKVDAK